MQRTHGQRRARRLVSPLISISTVVQPHEDPQRVVDAVQVMFPDWSPDRMPSNSGFPSGRAAEMMTGSSESLVTLLEVIRNQRILDTALDAMGLELDGSSTGFSLSRQAALAGKVSFVVKDRAIGGEMRVGLTGRGWRPGWSSRLGTRVEIPSHAVWVTNWRWPATGSLSSGSTAKENGRLVMTRAEGCPLVSISRLGAGQLVAI